ncbi:hypothetical protein GW17_00047525 [Ensete ventricosum]|nr:hypothetical protein GW17_00047525 [Ensete ventricosum]
MAKVVCWGGHLQPGTMLGRPLAGATTRSLSYVVKYEKQRSSVRSRVRVVSLGISSSIPIVGWPLVGRLPTGAASMEATPAGIADVGWPYGQRQYLLASRGGCLCGLNSGRAQLVDLRSGQLKVQVRIGKVKGITFMGILTVVLPVSDGRTTSERWSDHRLAMVVSPKRRLYRPG